MSDSLRPVNNSDLHAYVDGQLDPLRRAEVEDYLAQHPQAQARVHEYEKLNQALQQLYAPGLDGPVPPSLTHRPTTQRRWRFAARAAVAAGWILLGGIIGGLAVYQIDADENTTIAAQLIRPAVFAHTIYVPENLHPVEVSGNQEAHLVKWLSKRLHTQLQAPNLADQGFKLVGGRLLPSTNRMAAQFMYQDETGNRVTLYVRRGAWDNRETAFRYAHEGNVGVFYWIDGPMGYALSGELERDQLLRLAQLVVR